LPRHDARRDLPDRVIDYMESKVCCNPPEPFLLGGRIIGELGITRSDFYIAVGQMLGYRIGEYREGRRRYYFLLDMVNDYIERIRGRP
jgi:hypothetical protein